MFRLAPYISLAIAISSQCIADEKEKSAEDWVRLAIQSDSASKEPLGSSIPGATRTDFGTQVHQRCLDLYNKNASSDNSSETSSKVASEWITSTVGNIMGRCWNQYPETQNYLKDWISQMRRTVIICSSRMPSYFDFIPTLPYHAFQTDDVSVLRKNVAQKDILGIPQKDSSTGDNKYLVFGPDPLYAFIQQRIGQKITMAEHPLDDTEPGVNPLLTQMELYLAHEGFHSTGANNLNPSDHALYQQQALAGLGKIANPCDHRSATYDRVLVLSALCSGYKDPRLGAALGWGALSLHGGTFPDIMLALSERCPNYCQNLFTDSTSALKSAPLPAADARSLCDRILKTGESNLKLNLAREVNEKEEIENLGRSKKQSCP